MMPSADAPAIAASCPPPALAIERFTVRAGRIACDLSLAPHAPRRTTPALIRRVRREFPHIALHACVNESGPTFAAIMDDTPLPHLLEHLVIDLQARAAPDADAAYVGMTEWVDEEAGRARIEVNFTDDLAALRAFRDATAFLNRCMLP